MAAVQELEQYLEDKRIHPLFKSLLERICIERPANPEAFLLKTLSERAGDAGLGKSTSQSDLTVVTGNGRSASAASPDNDEDNEDDEAADGAAETGLQRRESYVVPKATEMTAAQIEQIKAARKRRAAVFLDDGDAESQESAAPATVVPKDAATKEALTKAMERNILFAHLDDIQKTQVLETMYAVEHASGDKIITQGEEGNHFFVLAEGTCDISIDTEDNVVKQVGAGDSFGELALIHNTPRAATVLATSACKLWAIDRINYRRILMNTTQERRKLYVGFIKKVPILEPLTEDEVKTVADALQPVAFKRGDVIIRQGDPGDDMFIVVEGECNVTQHDTDDNEVQIAQLGKMDIFGEIALLTNRPRLATVHAASDIVKTVRLDRKTFNRILGSCEDILRRNVKTYNSYMATKI